jgi:hypothetical protein
MTEKEKLIADIRNFDFKELIELGYNINNRKFRDIKKITNKSSDYNKLLFPYGDECIVYSGAEHNPMDGLKLPNITQLLNYEWQDGKGTFIPVMGSTLGHQHLQKQKYDNREFQEIYEFWGYGGMLLRNSQGITLHVLAPSEKVIIGTGDSMTFFNLQQSPLITLDYANPKMNSASKDLENEIGPLLMISKEPVYPKSICKKIRFKINNNYLNQNLITPKEISEVDVDVYAPLGFELYQQLITKKSYQRRFEDLGIKLSFGGNIPQNLKSEFSPMLIELVLNKNKLLFDNLGI